MFDIGFGEIIVIAVVALLVVGPKELPNLLRTVGATVRKMRRFVNEAKAELDQEIRKVDELKQLMTKEAEIAELHENIDTEKPTIPINRPSKGTQAASSHEASDTGMSVTDKTSGTSE